MPARARQLVVALSVFLAPLSMALAENPGGPPSSVTEAAPNAPQPVDPWFSWCAQGGAVSSQPASKPAEAPMPRLVPWVDYTGWPWHSAGATGDWGGLRQQLMDKGVRFDASITQIWQRNWAGGKHEGCGYTGNLEYGMQLDTHYAGLWPGGMLTVRGMSRYGGSDNAGAGALMPVNFPSLYPMPEQDTSALTDFYYVQFLAPWLGFMGGKMALEGMNPFAHDGSTQFLNTAFNFNPALATTVPLDCMAAGMILRPTDWLMLTTMLLDSDGVADECGFSTAFERGTTLYQNLEVGVKPFDLPGHQRVSWTHSDRSRFQFQQDAGGILSDFIKFQLGLGPRPSPARQSDDWSFGYSFDQYLYVLPGTKDQGVGVFGRFGVTSGEVNPIQQAYSLGLSGKGLIPARTQDTMGVGYYYIGLSDDLNGLVDRIPRRFRPRLEDEQGVELYYNIEITPWLHVSPDLQIIDPASAKVDTTVVAGLRVKIDF